MQPKSSKTFANAIAQLKSLYSEGQPTDFIAMEFMISPEIRRSVHPGSSLWKAMNESEKAIPTNGFAWFGSDNALSRLVEVTRAELQRAEPKDIDHVLSSLLTDAEPSFLSDASGK